MFEGKRFSGDELHRYYDEMARSFPAMCVIVLLTLTSASCASAVLPPNPTRTPKPTFTVEASGFEATADRCLEIKTPVVLPTTTPLATLTETPVPTSTPTATLTPEATSVPKPPETVTRVVKKTASPTNTSEPKETAVPEFPFELVGEPEFAPNCGTVYFKVNIKSRDGEPINGQKVRVDFWGNVVVKETGEQGEVGITPFGPPNENYHLPTEFRLELVGQDGETPLSSPLIVPFSDCETDWGQVGITFQKN